MGNDNLYYNFLLFVCNNPVIGLNHLPHDHETITKGNITLIPREATDEKSNDLSRKKVQLTKSSYKRGVTGFYLR